MSGRSDAAKHAFLRSEELIIDPKDPFANDKLDRKRFAEDLTRLVGTIKQPAVISVQASWGRGKTTFVRMWRRHIEQNGHLVLLYNAWRTDFVEDPLVAFVGELDAALEPYSDDDLLDKARKRMTAAVPTILRQSGEIVAQGAKGNLAETAKEFLGLLPDAMAAYSKQRQTTEGFRTQLNTIADQITSLQRPQLKSPIVVIVDELDRCRPDFAIRLLERIKHLFDVEGLVFVLSLDRDQLENAVRGAYGADIDPDGYLRRFINYSLELPNPPLEPFVDFLTERMRLHQTLTNDEVEGVKETFVTMVGSADRHKELSAPSLRTQEDCFTLINLAARTVRADNRGPCFGHLLAYLALVRECQQDSYYRFKKGLSVNATTLTQTINWAPGPFRNWLEAALAFGYSNASGQDQVRKRAQNATPGNPNLQRAVSEFTAGNWDWEIVPKVKAAMDLSAIDDDDE